MTPFGWVTGRRVHGGPFDVTHHANTSDRVLGIHIAGPSAPGQFAESWADMLFVKGFDAGQPIVYLSTDAGQPLTAVLQRSVYVPALNDASFNGGDDFLGSARERLFGFINGQTGVNNPQAQGFQHLAKDGMVGQDIIDQFERQVLGQLSQMTGSEDAPGDGNGTGDRGRGRLNSQRDLWWLGRS